jgi:hypothetical protein
MMRTALVIVSLAVPTTVTADSEIGELASLLEGRFENLATDTKPDDRMVDERVRLDAPLLGEFVFYQQIRHKEGLEVYRQRVLVLEVSADSGRIEQNAYSLKQPEWYVDADANAFASLSKDGLNDFMSDGCEMVWSRSDDGFRGHVDPEKCVITSSRTGKPRRIEAEALLAPTTLSLAERGFDADSREQLFGTATGEYLLLRRTR